MKLTTLIDYTIWADSKYIEYVQQVSDDDYNQKIDGINRSMAEVVFHIVEVLGYWYYRLQDKEYPNPPDESTPKSELLEEWKKLHGLIIELVNTPEDFIKFTLQWYEEDQPVETGTENVLFNFVTHNAYHRGQLALLLRFHGIEGLSETDFNPYIYQLFQNQNK